MSIKFRGVREVTSNMRRSANGAQSGAARGARSLASQVLKTSQGLVPVETGALKSSGRTESHMNMYGISVSVAYGARDSRNSARYAVYVHEDLNAFHPTGQAKFLEVAWLSVMSGALLEYKFYVGRAIEEAVR